MEYYIFVPCLEYKGGFKIKIEKEFTLLNIETKERKIYTQEITDENQEKEIENQEPIDEKENKKIYLIINVLDDDMESCRFFVFKEDLVNEIIQNANKIKAMQKVLIDINLIYNGKNWNCYLDNILFSY